MRRATTLLEQAQGSIGLVDGPIHPAHASLQNAQIEEVGPAVHLEPADPALQHGTFVAGLLARLCPKCRILARAIFGHGQSAGEQSECDSQQAAEAVIDLVNRGVRVLNLSFALTDPSLSGSRRFEAALDYAMRRGTLVVTAAGNHGRIGCVTLARHPWIIPVAVCDDQFHPLPYSNVGPFIASHGLMVPAASTQGIVASGGLTKMGGTSIAAPFVTAALAFLCWAFPNAPASQLKTALGIGRRDSRPLLPPVLDVWAAYTTLGGQAA